MLFDTEYRTIKKRSEGIYKEKGSKFIAICKPVFDVQEFKDFLQSIRTEYPGAVHYCYAYRIGYDKQLYRFNDDGEPSGSAGKPIYNVILSKDLSNVGIIVVRYFGGTLLGVPGLINAYKQSSIEAINENEIVIVPILERGKIEFQFEKMNIAMRIIKEHQLKIVSQDALNNYVIELEIPIKNAEKVRSAFQTNQIVYSYLKTY